MRTTILAIALALLAPWASASTVSLQAPASVVAGEQFEVTIIGDFGSFELLAGAVQILFDPGLASVNDFSFAVPVFPHFSCPGTPACPDDPPGTFGIAFGGDFIGPLLIEPDAGPTLMGTLTMTATQSIDNVTPLVLGLIDWEEPIGGWFDGALMPIPTPQFFGTTIDIRPVPLPATAWLLLGALGVLGGLRRHQGKGSSPRQSQLPKENGYSFLRLSISHY